MVAHDLSLLGGISEDVAGMLKHLVSVSARHVVTFIHMVISLELKCDVRWKVQKLFKGGSKQETLGRKMLEKQQPGGKLRSAALYNI